MYLEVFVRQWSRGDTYQFSAHEQKSMGVPLINIKKMGDHADEHRQGRSAATTYMEQVTM
jgi:hypothetical protein